MGLFDNFFSNFGFNDGFFENLHNFDLDFLENLKDGDTFEKDGIFYEVKFKKTPFGDSLFISGSNKSTTLSTKNKLVKNKELVALEADLTKAINEERFEDAVILRDKIKTEKEKSVETNKLKSDLQIAIKEENFEEAARLRDLINGEDNKVIDK